MRDTRIILSDCHIELSQVDDNGRALFLVSNSEAVEEDQGRIGATKFKMQLKPGMMAKFVFDYFLEIYSANALPPVRRSLSNGKFKSIAEFYERKDAFVKQKISEKSVPDAFGTGGADMKYACFHNSMRQNRDLFSIAQVDAAMALWDEFIQDELGDCIAGFDTISDETKQWKRVHGQISHADLADRLKKRGPGSYVLIDQRKSVDARSNEKVFEQVRTVFGETRKRTRNSRFNGAIAIYPSKNFWDMPLSDTIRSLIDSGYLQIFRIWVG